MKNKENTTNKDDLESKENEVSTEGIENIDNIENTVDMEKTENTENIDNMENTENTENTDSTESTEGTESIENTEKIKFADKYKSQKEKFRLSDKIVAYIVTIIILLMVAVPIAIYCINKDVFKKSDYIYLKDRTSYTIQNVDGNFLNNFYGNSNTMVIFMASWCSHCVDEKNELNNFIKNNPDKKVIIVSHDHTYEALEKYLKDSDLNWFVIFDKDKTIRKHIDPGTDGIPSAYLLDKNGKIIGFSKGIRTEVEFNQFYNNEIDIYEN